MEQIDFKVLRNGFRLVSILFCLLGVFGRGTGKYTWNTCVKAVGWYYNIFLRSSSQRTHSSDEIRETPQWSHRVRAPTMKTGPGTRSTTGQQQGSSSITSSDIRMHQLDHGRISSSPTTFLTEHASRARASGRTNRPRPAIARTNLLRQLSSSWPAAKRSQSHSLSSSFAGHGWVRKGGPQPAELSIEMISTSCRAGSVRHARLGSTQLIRYSKLNYPWV